MRSSTLALLAISVMAFTACPDTSKPPCGPSSCTGCCDSSGACVAGVTVQACGAMGATCAACSVTDSCSFGKCTPPTPFNQGGGSAGGTAGGVGGGAGGGSTTADGGTLDGGAPVDAGTPNPCAGTLTSCNGRCLDLSSELENCGTCGKTCGQGEVCNRGRCAVLPDDCTQMPMGCGSGFYCDPVSKKCMTGCRLTADCPMGATCSSGTCTCPTGQHACGQTCVPDDATASCGTRCSVCAQPANSTSTCSSGACGFTCATGYLQSGGACVDIDECTTNNGGCSASATCTNTPGSRTCACNAGFSGDGVTCTDINECLTNNGGCAGEATCTNTPGARTCACNTGYTGDGLTCADVNECATNNGGCSTNATCANTPGARTCTCITGFTGDGVTCTDVNECLTNNGGCAVNATCTNTPGTRTCACNVGFMGDGLTCADVDECATNNGGCAATATCTNTVGARTCTCNTGYSGNGLSCTDVNECLTGNGGCAATGGVCTNTVGSRTCACATGYTGDGFTCTDVDECATNNGGCASVASGGLCTNTPGSRSCSCTTGFTGNGLSCADVNECLVSNGGCASVASGGVCTNTVGSRICACASGFSGTGLVCTDIDECATNNGGCAATSSGGVCTNTPGSRTCTCASGYTGTGLVCSDIDECATNNGGCAAVAAGGICTNTPGSRTCACGPGFAGNGFTCAPNGDTCSAPLPLTLGTTVSGTTVGATHSFGTPLSAACSNAAVSGPDVVYAFTPSSSGAFLVNGVVTAGTARFWASSTCGVASACAQSEPDISPNSFVVRGTAGQPLYVHADSASAATGNFTLQLTSVTPPTNDTCAAATVMTAGVPLSGSLVNAVNDYWPNAPCANTTRRKGEVVFTFTPPTSGQYAFRETTSTDVVMWLANACDNSCTSSVDDPEVLVANLTAGTPVFFFVEPYGTPATYTVQVDAVVVPGNDTCASPTALTAGVTVNGSTVGAANDYGGPLATVACGGAGALGKDVVYSFTPATSGNFTVTTTAITPSYNPRVWVSGTCGTSSACVLEFGQTFSLHGTAGVPLFLHVDETSAGVGGDFSIVVNPVATPPNDLCAAPQVLTLGTPATGTLVGAVDDVQPNLCTPINLSRNGEVVFSFTPPTTGPYIFRETTALQGLFWVNTTCAGACVDGSASDALSVNLTAGTPYFVFLETTGASAAYSVTVTAATPPSNDTCASPTALTLNTTVNGSTLTAANDFSGPLSAACGGQSVPARDVVYSFTPSTTGTYRVGFTATGPNRVWASSSCGLANTCTALLSPLGNEFWVRGTASTPMYFAVDGFGSGDLGDHSIVVQSAVSPPNETCATATALTVGGVVNGTTVGAVDDVRAAASCGVARGGEVVYSFTPSTTGTYYFRETSLTDVVMWVSTACDGTCGAGAYVDDPEVLSMSLTAGTTYFLFVEPYSAAGPITVTLSTN
ncbi:MAG: hypothetical protein JNM69_37470 [Archangium sp.]|nr:hypothetical protein [Archangium sp.]